MTGPDEELRAVLDGLGDRPPAWLIESLKRGCRRDNPGPWSRFRRRYMLGVDDLRSAEVIE